MTLKLQVPNMACSACGETITQAITSIDPNAQVNADPKTKLVNVETTAPETEIRKAIAAAGYEIASVE
ncbi:MAG: hypothetical protein Kow00121_54280 [Elainellaceae cyanobacterium]